MKLLLYLGLAYAAALGASAAASGAGAFRKEAAGDTALVLPLWGVIASLVLGAHAYAFCARKAEECRAADREEEEREFALKMARLNAGLPEAEEIDAE